jgi:hypothetical protein
MSLSMYQASIPVLLRALGNLQTILDKAAAHAEARKIDPAVFINARLAPDMFALARQVQIATDAAKGCAARLAGVEIPSYADTETTFPELKARIAKTMAFLKSVDQAQVEGGAERPVKVKFGGKDISFTGRDYLLDFVLPHFFFHVTAAYAILRHNGVELGKMDYLGSY